METGFRPLALDRLQMRVGGGCLSVFGLPFFAAGLFLLLVTVGLVPVSNAEDIGLLAALVMALMGALFTAVGGGLVLGRQWITVDGTRRVLVTETGLLVPMRSTTQPLDGYTTVAIGFDAGDSDTADRFPVTFTGPGRKALAICRTTDYARARSGGAAIAQLLRLDLEDASSDHPVRLPGTHAALPYVQRVRLDGTNPKLLPRPGSARSQAVTSGGAVHITIPLPAVHPIAIAVSLVPMVVVLYVAGPMSEFFRRTGTPPVVSWFSLGFVGIVFGLVPLVSALNRWRRSRRGATLVTASSVELRVEQRGAWRTRPVAAVPAAEILDLDFSTRESSQEATRRAVHDKVGSTTADLGPRAARIVERVSRYARGRGITVKSNRGLLTVGEGLADDEIRYLHALVHHALLGRAR